MAFKRQRPRKKVCYFTKNKIDYIDYSDMRDTQWIKDESLSIQKLPAKFCQSSQFFYLP